MGQSRFGGHCINDNTFIPHPTFPRPNQAAGRSTRCVQTAIEASLSNAMMRHGHQNAAQRIIDKLWRQAVAGLHFLPSPTRRRSRVAILICQNFRSDEPDFIRKFLQHIMRPMCRECAVPACLTYRRDPPDWPASFKALKLFCIWCTAPDERFLSLPAAWP